MSEISQLQINGHTYNLTDANAITRDSLSYIIPVGSVQYYLGVQAPSKWLFCDGSAVSRTTYAELFAVCGTAYGEGDGSTTFNLPNFVGRVIVGSCNTTGTPMTIGSNTLTGHGDDDYVGAGVSTWYHLGEYAGSTKVTLVTGNLPSHSHTVTMGSHSHGTGSTDYPSFLKVNGGGNGMSSIAGGNPSGSGYTYPIIHNTTAKFSHQASTESKDLGTKTSSSVGSGTAFYAQLPYGTANYIVYAGV